MYYNKPKNRRFAEDSFDLERYKDNFIKSKYETYVKKNKKYVNIISGFIAIFTVVLGVLVYALVMYYVNLWNNDKLNREATNFTPALESNLTVDSAISILSPGASGKEIIYNESTNEAALLSEEPKQAAEKQNAKKEIPLAFKSIREKHSNDEIIGHVKIDGSKINYYFAQAKDNDYYLTRSLNKSQNVTGSIFLDYENKIEELDRNTILYGHNMRDGSMFHNVRLYKDKYYYDTHKYIDFSTLYESSKWEIFAFYEATTDFDYIKVNFNSEENFGEFLEEIKSRSLYDTGVSVSTHDKILTLSTCTNKPEDTRYVIQAKLIKSSPISN